MNFRGTILNFALFASTIKTRLKKSMQKINNNNKKSRSYEAANKSIDPTYWGYSTDFSAFPSCRGVENGRNALGRLLVPYFFNIRTL